MCFIDRLHNSQQFVQVFTERINPSQIHSQHPKAGYSCVGRHFNLSNHSISLMILQGFEALGNHKIVRMSREKLWIRRLQTIQPHGLNIQEGNV